MFLSSNYGILEIVVSKAKSEIRWRVLVVNFFEINRIVMSTRWKNRKIYQISSCG